MLLFKHNIEESVHTFNPKWRAGRPPVWFYLDYYLATDRTTRAILQDYQSVQTGPKAKSNILTAVHT